MLPRASLSFTIPSIHDQTNLDCRVFHPTRLTNPSPSDPRWNRHIAIVAHPYAPLGGCFDDPIVDLVGGTLLHLGFMVATFNFRGASSSSGARTSWTSRPEQADYMSVVGFMAYYAHYMDLPHHLDNGVGPSPPPSPPIVLQAGYSYGAMVTTRLPPLDAILAAFDSPAVHTPAADIRLRAQHLAEQQNRLYANSPTSPRRSLGMRVGGDDEVRRAHSVEDREEKIRRGVKEILARTRRGRGRSRHGTPQGHAGGAGGAGAHSGEEKEEEEECMARVEGLPAYRSAYLAVSPPVGYVTNLATMSFPNPFGSWSSRRAGRPVADHDGAGDGEHHDSEGKLARNPTLVVYGDQDGFLTLRKLREWTARLEAYDSSQFREIEVAGAGHFWAEEGVIYKLRDAVGFFGTGLLRNDTWRRGALHSPPPASAGG